MTDQKPTGVFMQFPLTEAQVSACSDARAKAWSEQGKPTTTSTFEAALLAIGVHVHGEGIPVVGTIHIGENGKPFFAAPELYSTGGDVVRQSEAQAQIAVHDAEIVRLREENERLKHKLKPQFFCSDILEEDSMSTREELVEHARDYDDDLQPFSVFEMEGYAKTHTSHGFFDKDNKCHWFNTEQEALCAAKALKGGAA